MFFLGIFEETIFKSFVITESGSKSYESFRQIRNENS